MASKGPGHGGENGSSVDLHALWWDKKQSHQVKVSQSVGPSGGTISIPETGFTMVIPAGALSSTLNITVTADERYVAYKMEPTGTQFQQDVVVTQLLTKTSLGGQPLRDQIYAAYLADDNAKLSGKIPVAEIEPSTTIFSTLNPLIPQAQVWIIKHFSRYMLASG
ncbi:MAG TPA: hypothetical protein VJ840_01655 [Gemmatimonadaceae bacterium]|nr:hypothetical protein [Gemmatimonadaceae bacterium]